MNDTVHKLVAPEAPKSTLAELASDMELKRAMLHEAKLTTAAAVTFESDARKVSKAADRAFNEAVNALRPKRPRTKLGEKP